MNLFILLPFIPMLGGILTLIYHFKKQNTNLITNVFMGISLILSIILVFNRVNTNETYNFLELNGAHLKISFCIDNLSVIMLLMINFISFIIHRYSTNYLSSDITQGRFMAQLSILTSSVSVLVISGNLLTAFIAWQFIGLSLYILLNHYHYDIFANKAAKKKFIINRLGDVSFLLAVILCYKFFGSSDFNCTTNSHHYINVLGVISCNINTVIALLVFIAVMTKSAQFPFHIWLPDTMEAPTPVSAIMHAGVINAGGFLLTRIHSMINLSMFASNVIYTIGILTILTAAFFILTQSDVKKQLAYSTMGQMGYMVVECSLGFYSAAIFHLIAHGFFKAFLFLSSGNNIGQINNNIESLRANFRAKISKIVFFLSLYFIIFHYINIDINNSLLLIGAFILVSILNLYFDLETIINLNYIKKMIIGITIMFVFIIYFILSLKLSKFIGFEETINNNHMFNLYKLVILLSIVLIQLVIWINVNLMPQKITLVIYHLSRNKFFIEDFYRWSIINPFRRLGIYLNKLFLKSHLKIISTIIIVSITCTCIFKIEAFNIKIILFIIQVLFLLYIITANKASNIRGLLNSELLQIYCLKISS